MTAVKLITDQERSALEIQDGKGCETLSNLASALYGTRVLFSTDDFFATAENMLADGEPVWKADAYTEYGKWMDGWETRRKRTPGHDWCVLELGLKGSVEALEIDTRFFTGNQAPGISVLGASLDAAQAAKFAEALPPRHAQLGAACTQQDLLHASSACGRVEWHELLPPCPLRPGYQGTSTHFLRTGDNLLKGITHLRVNLFPDGGIARFRALGRVSHDWAASAPAGPVDLAALEHGGCAIACSDRHYGHPRNLTLRGRSQNMAGGWETARNPARPAVFVRDPASGQLECPGRHWTLLRLGCPARGDLAHIEIDTNWFKGNYPESAAVYGFASDEPDQAWTRDRIEALLASAGDSLVELLPRSRLGPHAQHFFRGPACRQDADGPLDQLDRQTLIERDGGWESASVARSPRPLTHVLLVMYPDGGISRLRVVGWPLGSG